MLCIPLMLFAALSNGCGDTKDKIAAMEKTNAVLRSAAAKDLANRLIKDPNVAQAGDVQLYVSERLLSQALTLLDGLVIQVPSPDVKDLSIRIDSIRPVFSSGFAGLTIDATASRGSLSIKCQGVALLVPEKLPPAQVTQVLTLNPLPQPALNLINNFVAIFHGKALAPLVIPIGYRTFIQDQPLRFRAVVNSIVPNVTWGPFSSDLKGFAQEFALLTINDEINKRIPAIEVPLQNVITLKQAATKKDLKFFDDKLGAQLSIPAVAWSATFSLREVVVLQRGIHLIGSIANPGVAQ